MIPITPDIIGPGIEEEYTDAFAAIDDLRIALGDRPLTNDTPEGSVLLNVQWVEQEMRAGRLPIPVDESFVGTIFYLVGSNELGNVPGFQEALGRLWLVLKGYGLMKPRHVPVLIAMIDDYLAEAERCDGRLTLDDRRLLDDLDAAAKQMERSGEPFEAPKGTRSYSARSSDALNACVKGGHSRLSFISASLLEDWRPEPARKPPLAAPMAGLPPRAPVLPRELEGRLP